LPKVIVAALLSLYAITVFWGQLFLIWFDARERSTVVVWVKAFEEDGMWLPRAYLNKILSIPRTIFRTHNTVFQHAKEQHMGAREVSPIEFPWALYPEAILALVDGQ
jgi:hypothetical protein